MHFPILKSNYDITTWFWEMEEFEAAADAI